MKVYKVNFNVSTTFAKKPILAQYRTMLASNIILRKHIHIFGNTAMPGCRENNKFQKLVMNYKWYDGQLKKICAAQPLEIDPPSPKEVELSGAKLWYIWKQNQINLNCQIILLDTCRYCKYFENP